MSYKKEEKKKKDLSILGTPILAALNKSLKNRARRRFAIVLAGIVVFTTTYSLILPALTLENNTASKMPGWKPASIQAELLNCQIDIHQHSVECYEMVDGEKTLVCGQADYVLHTHDENCYDKKGNLVCTLPEIGKSGDMESGDSEDKELT